MNRISLIVLVLCALVGVSLCSPESDRNQIFAKSGYPPMEPAETLETLKRLSDSYSQGNLKKIHKDERQVETLISVSEVTKDRCSQDFVDQMNNLLKINSAYKVNLVPFLKHYKEDLIDRCRNEFGVTGLSSETASDDYFKSWSA